METILLQIESGLGTWLLNQAGLVVVMGVVIWWLAKRYEKAEQDKTDLAKEFIKLMVSVESKMDLDKSDNSEIKQQLNKLIDLVSKWQK